MPLRFPTRLIRIDHGYMTNTHHRRRDEEKRRRTGYVLPRMEQSRPERRTGKRVVVMPHVHCRHRWISFTGGQ